MGLTPRQPENSASKAPLGAREPLPRSVANKRLSQVEVQRARHVDALLDALAKRERIPSQLSWRVYAASVEHLPGRLVRDRGWRRVSRSRFHTSVWGQVAMAASVALTFAAASWFMAQPTTTTTPGDGFAHHSEPLQEVIRLVTPVSDPQPVRWWLDDLDLDIMNTAYDTRLPEVVGDVEMVRQDLGL